VPEAPEPDDPHGFAAEEKTLLRLARALDQPMTKEPYRLAMLALGQRSRTLFRAFRQVQRGRAAAAAPALLRPMVEINVLIRFLTKSPELHTELWEMEGERNAITIAHEFTSSPAMSERWEAYAFDMAAFDERKTAVEEARKRAIEAKIPGIKETGPVLPSISQQLLLIDEPAADEAYTLGYRALSWDVHGGARAMLAGRFREHRDGTVSYTEDRDATDPPRALAISTFASTLKLCGFHLELGIEQEAEDVLRTFVPQSPDRPEPGWSK
jgi:Family of unknown function (DUF5677)